MASLSTATVGEMTEFNGRLSRAGLTAELVRNVNNDDGAAGAMIQALTEHMRIAAEAKVKNPFELPIEEKIAALRLAIKEEGWKLGEEEIQRLLTNVPVYKRGRHIFLSFKIRFGTGQEGVEFTFEAHAKRFTRVHKKNWRWPELRSGEKHLRLLADNETHKPTIEWCVVDLEANRERSSITDVRGPNSLADEGIVLGWLFPKRVEAIDHKEWCAWYLGGYELNVPEDDDESWQRVPCVGRGLDDGASELNACSRGDDGSGYSVPVTRGV